MANITRERFESIFSEDSGRWEGDRALEGLLIIAKYIDPKKKVILEGAGHDIIYGPSVDKIIDAGISEEDSVRLRQISWMIEKDTDSLACFV